MKRVLYTAITAIFTVCLAQCAPEEKDNPVKSEQLAVNLTSTAAELQYGEKADFSYSFTNASGKVTVNCSNCPDGVSFTDNGSKDGFGSFSFESALDEDKVTVVDVLFKDNRSTVEKTISLTTHERPLDFSLIVDSDSQYIYPYGTEHPTRLNFTITCESDIDEIIVNASEGLRTENTIEQDNKSGRIDVFATQELEEKGDVTITAKNASGENSKTITLVKGYLSVNEGPIDIVSTKTTGMIAVQTNLKYGIEVESSSMSYLTASADGNKINYEFAENPTMNQRVGRIVVKDENKIITHIIAIRQAPSTGNTQTDINALRALYVALHMEDWPDYGSHGHYLKDWLSDDKPACYWLGVTWTNGYNETNPGRVWQIAIDSPRIVENGVATPINNKPSFLPEEFGHLTKLREVMLDGAFNIQLPLPDSFENLINLTFVSFQCNHLNGKLDDMVPLKNLLKNPNNRLNWVNLEECGLYGEIPEWLADIKCAENAGFWLPYNHLSGQVPDKVANTAWWNHMSIGYYKEMEAWPRFDKSKYPNMTEDKWYYFIPTGEMIMLLQNDNYALWVGERPENTKWVEDAHGGHWEWTD